ncbi:PilW family protein [Pseudomonas sp. NPDC077649]|uniref:PilW family protein n=1 Tax=Pseudomonas sp. NPDC077649 TaxID=3364423 RepID=UPI0037C619AB
MRKQRGLSLIELMVAMLLGLIVTGAVLQVFLSSKTTFVMQGNLNRLQENGRFALQYLAQQVRPAGIGLGVRLPEESICVVASNADPADWAGINRPVWGRTSAGAAGELGVAGSDEVHVFANDGCEAFLTEGEVMAPGKNANVKVDRYCPSMQQNQLVMVADLQKAVVIRITNAPNANVKEPTLAHAAGTNNAAALCGGFKFSEIRFESPARIFGFAHRVFYVAETGRNGVDGRPLHALFVRNSATGVAEEMVEGVQSMRAHYGLVAAGGVGVRDYLSAAEVEAANRWDDVRTLSFELLLESDGQLASARDQTVVFDGAAVAADGRLRQVYRTVVALRNRID